MNSNLWKALHAECNTPKLNSSFTENITHNNNKTTKQSLSHYIISIRHNLIALELQKLPFVHPTSVAILLEEVGLVIVFGWIHKIT